MTDDEFSHLNLPRDDVPRPSAKTVFELARRHRLHDDWCRLPEEEQERRIEERGESIWYRVSPEAKDVLDWLGALLVRHRMLHPMGKSQGSRAMNLRAWGEQTGNLDLDALGVALERGWSDARIVAVIRFRMDAEEVRRMSEQDGAGLETLAALKGRPSGGRRE